VAEKSRRRGLFETCAGEVRRGKKMRLRGGEKYFKKKIGIWERIPTPFA